MKKLLIAAIVVAGIGFAGCGGSSAPAKSSAPVKSVPTTAPGPPPGTTYSDGDLAYLDGYTQGLRLSSNGGGPDTCIDTPLAATTVAGQTNNFLEIWWLFGCQAGYHRTANKPPFASPTTTTTTQPAPTTPFPAAGPPVDALNSPAPHAGPWMPAPQSLVTVMNTFNTTHGYANGGIAVDNSWISVDTNNPSYYLFVSVTGSGSDQQDLGGYVQQVGSSWQVSGIGMNGWTCTTLVPASVFADFGASPCTEPGFNS